MGRTRQCYVAVVDDDESLCRSLGRLLLRSEIQPITYQSVEAFLADTNRPQLDCLILNIHLGIELHRQLTAAGSRTPVIYLTARDEPETRDEAIAAGCLAYFRKTDPGEAVIKAVRRAANPEEEPW